MHVVPDGQHAYSPQQTAFGRGQHPTVDGLKPDEQHVAVADGQRVKFHSEYGPPFLFGEEARGEWGECARWQNSLREKLQPTTQ